MNVDFVLFVNRRLQTRFVQYYFDAVRFAPMSIAARAAFERTVARACLRRRDSHAPLFELNEQTIAYRRFASLLVVVGVRKSENAVAMQTFVQLLVEALSDVFGGSVSELDILFGNEKVHSTLDYMVADGAIVETGRAQVVQPVRVIEQL